MANDDSALIRAAAALVDLADEDDRVKSLAEQATKMLCDSGAVLVLLQEVSRLQQREINQQQASQSSPFVDRRAEREQRIKELGKQLAESVT